MALPSSGIIKLSDVNTELNLAVQAPINIGSEAVRGLFGVTTGVIRLSDGYGKSSVIPIGLAAGGGTLVGGNQANAEQYTFSNNTWTTTGSMPAGRGSCGAFSSTTMSYIAGGWSGSTTVNSSVYKYSYSSGTFTTGTSMSAVRAELGAISAKTFGIIGGGRNSSSSYANQTTVTEKYLHSNDAVSVTTSLTPARADYRTFGTDVYGIFTSGYDTANATYAGHDKYTYSNDTITAMGALRAVLRRNSAITGNKQVAIDFGGSLSTGATETGTTDKFIHSSQTWTSGSTSTSPRRQLFAVGSSTVGVFSFGFSGTNAFSPTTVSVSEKYTYATDAITSAAINSRIVFSITGVSNAWNGLT